MFSPFPLCAFSWTQYAFNCCKEWRRRSFFVCFKGDIDERMSYRYNTRSNKTRIVKTPGGELRLLHIKKRGTAPKCGDCGAKLPGVSGYPFTGTFYLFSFIYNRETGQVVLLRCMQTAIACGFLEQLGLTSNNSRFLPFALVNIRKSLARRSQSAVLMAALAALAA